MARGAQQGEALETFQDFLCHLEATSSLHLRERAQGCNQKENWCS